LLYSNSFSYEAKRGFNEKTSSNRFNFNRRYTGKYFDWIHKSLNWIFAGCPKRWIYLVRKYGFHKAFSAWDFLLGSLVLPFWKEGVLVKKY